MNIQCATLKAILNLEPLEWQKEPEGAGNQTLRCRPIKDTQKY